MVDPAVLMKGIEEDPSLLAELEALGGGGGGGEEQDAGLKGASMGTNDRLFRCLLFRPDPHTHTPMRTHAQRSSNPPPTATPCEFPPSNARLH